MTISLIDAAEGSFKYTPSGSTTGTDGFVYVVRDEYGNYSPAATFEISVIERMSPVVYEDMTDSESYNAAVALTGMGVMNGTVMGDEVYFDPDGKVTRAEFLAMAMKALGIRADESLTETFFDDNAAIPKALLKYVATAQKRGVVNGAFEKDGLYFRPNDAITRYEAAIIMANLVGARDTTLETFAADDASAIPIWARAHVGAMCTLGVLDKAEALEAPRAELTRAEAADCLYALTAAVG